jgi:hypothetical protein
MVVDNPFSARGTHQKTKARSIVERAFVVKAKIKAILRAAGFASVWVV